MVINIVNITLKRLANNSIIYRIIITNCSGNGGKGDDKEYQSKN